MGAESVRENLQVSDPSPDNNTLNQISSFQPKGSNISKGERRELDI